jgi:N-acetylglutamate synthase-like GNAT family acetyltransferase
MIEITVTEDWRALIPFFIENDLEFEEGEEYGDDEIVKCWRADAVAAADDAADATDEPDATTATTATAEPTLVGACILAMREGEYICDGIAVSPEHRKDGLGRKMLDLLLKEAACRGAARVFLVARAPAFFARSGFVPVPRTDAPEFFECFSCPQYGKTCHPEVMRLTL